ncbi:hypothetical protein CEK28_04855 [Xenophilus sp. AP218F]|nr:hypothetical protein CEK28_04855 [Xenophilus sp. AP218F]
MASIDPIREARRAYKRADSAKFYLNQLPDDFRAAIFNNGMPHCHAVTLQLSPQTLRAMLEAIIAVELTRDRLTFLLDNCQAQPAARSVKARRVAPCNS